jgi:GntR family transcriptional regulator
MTTYRYDALVAVAAAKASLLARVDPLDRVRGGPALFFQITQRLTDLIEGLNLGEGYALPTERELSERFGVSRITARQALAELEKKGLVRREQGRGTFVAERKIPRESPRLTSFSDDMRAKGARPSTRLVRLDEVTPPPMVADRLHLPSGRPALRLFRLMLANRRPMALHETFLSPEIISAAVRESIKEAAHNPHFSLYGCLEQAGITFTHAEEQIGAIALQRDEARLLEVARATPAFEMVRVTYVRGDRPLEYCRGIYRGDRYQYLLKTYPREQSGTEQR